MLKARRAAAQTHLRLVKEKPEPDALPKDKEFLDSILEHGFSYKKYLCIDSVGCERPSLTKRYSVTLCRPKAELHLFLRSALGGTPLSEAGEERIASIMMDAEFERLVHLREIK